MNKEEKARKRVTKAFKGLVDAYGYCDEALAQLNLERQRWDPEWGDFQIDEDLLYEIVSLANSMLLLSEGVLNTRRVSTSRLGRSFH